MLWLPSLPSLPLQLLLPVSESSCTCLPTEENCKGHLFVAEERAKLELACNTLLKLSIGIAPPMNQLKA